MQIRQVSRWILKCHACYAVTSEIGSIFCPKCAKGGTLRKVAVPVGENGIVLAARRPRITLRGTKFSLPLPQVEEMPSPRTSFYVKINFHKSSFTPRQRRNRTNRVTSDDIFGHHTDKRAPLQPPRKKGTGGFRWKEESK